MFELVKAAGAAHLRVIVPIVLPFDYLMLAWSQKDKPFSRRF